MPEAVVIVVFLIFYLTWAAIKALYRLLTGATRRERKEEQRRLEELLRQERARQRQEELHRRAIENAKQQFEEAVMNGRFPSDELLAILEDCGSVIPVNVKEATLYRGERAQRDIR